MATDEMLRALPAFVAVCAAIVALVFIVDYWAIFFARSPFRFLRKLARNLDKSIVVAFEVAQNHRVTPDELHALSTEANQYVRCLVARNPRTGADTFRIIANDPAPAVRHAIMENPNAPEDVSTLIALEMMVDAPRK